MMGRILLVLGGIVGSILVLILVTAGYLYIDTRGEYSVPLTAEHDPSIPTLTLNEATFHVQTFGADTSQLVMILHGGPGNDFRYLLPLQELQDEYKVVFYDQRGTGLSPRVDPEELTLESSLTDLEEMIDHFSPDRKVNLVGNSWGGMLASGYLARNPQRVDKVVIAEPGMLSSEQGEAYLDRFKIKPDLAATMAMLRIAFESLHLSNTDAQAKQDYIFGKIPLLDFPGNPMRKYFCNEDPGSAAMAFWRLGAEASINIQGGAINEQGEVEIDLISGVEEYPGTVLFVVSECNQLIGEAFQLNHMKYFPRTRLAVIKNAGHTMFGEQPDSSLAVIREYFKSSSSEGVHNKAAATTQESGQES